VGVEPSRVQNKLAPGVELPAATDKLPEKLSVGGVNVGVAAWPVCVYVELPIAELLNPEAVAMHFTVVVVDIA
jgi:hypothetical protein